MDGILAELKPEATIETLLYFDDTVEGAMCNLFFVNQSSITDYVRIALAAPYIYPEPQSYVAYDTMVPPNHTVALHELAVSKLEQIFVYSQNGTTSFVYTGQTY